MHAFLRHRAPIVAGVFLIGLAAVTTAAGQRRATTQIWNGGFGFTEPPRLPTSTTFTGGFNFCRLAFNSSWRGKRGWSTDYPGADINFSVRLGELTKARVATDEEGHPEYVVVRPTDDALFACPMVFAEDAGTAVFSNREVESLRRYLLKGGFLFASDYWGTTAGEQLDEQMARVLPADKYPIFDVPMSHPVWHTMFDLKDVPQMASIQYWRRSGGGISERGADSDTVEVRGIADSLGRLMVLMVHNSDIPDGWEREGADPEYFARFSPDAYRVGIDIAIYAMTH
jgi:uncharacterized protein DUF4159